MGNSKIKFKHRFYRVGYEPFVIGGMGLVGMVGTIVVGKPPWIPCILVAWAIVWLIVRLYKGPLSYQFTPGKGRGDYRMSVTFAKPGYYVPPARMVEEIDKLAEKWESKWLPTDIKINPYAIWDGLPIHFQDTVGTQWFKGGVRGMYIFEQPGFSRQVLVDANQDDWDMILRYELENAIGRAVDFDVDKYYEKGVAAKNDIGLKQMKGLHPSSFKWEVAWLTWKLERRLVD